MGYKKELPFRVYNPTPEAKKLLSGWDAQVVVEGLLNRIHALKQTLEIEKQWYEELLRDNLGTPKQDETVESIQTVERRMLENALKQGTREDAAKALGISQRTVYRKIKEYNLE